jgi:hypothetical protein
MASGSLLDFFAHGEKSPVTLQFALNPSNSTALAARRPCRATHNRDHFGDVNEMISRHPQQRSFC